MEMRSEEREVWSKRFLSLMESPWAYYAVLLFPILQYAGFTFFGPRGTLLVAVLGFVMVPLVDWMLGPASRVIRRTDAEKRFLERQWSFRIVTYFYALVMYPMLSWSIGQAVRSPSTGVYIGLAFGMGIVSSVGLNISHELMHKSLWAERAAGKFILSCVGNFYYFVEHTRGHHKLVGTAEDAATSQFGESFYRYWPRMISTSIQDAWALEIERAKQNRSNSVFNTANVMLQSIFMSAFVVATLALTHGVDAIRFFFWQAFVAWFLLDLINYVEHYGLVRLKDSDGKYSGVTRHLSWDSCYPMSNIM